MKQISKRERRRLTFRRKILRSGEQIFLRKKYSSVTTDEIAAKAGVTKRTLYKHFPSKLSLFMSMFDHYLNEIAKKMLSASKMELPPDTKILMLFDIFYEFTKKNEKFMRLYWMLDSEEFEGEMPEELSQYVTEHVNSLIVVSADASEVARKEGRIIDIDPLILAHLMSAINKGIFIHVSKERRFGVSTPDADELYRLMHVIMQQGLFKRTVYGVKGRK